MLSQSVIESTFGKDAFPKVDHSGKSVRITILTGNGPVFHSRWEPTVERAANYTEGMISLLGIIEKGGN